MDRAQGLLARREDVVSIRALRVTDTWTSSESLP